MGVCSPSTDIIMRSFAAILTFVLAINYSLAVEWADSGIKLSNSQQACYANDELYQIMKTGSSTYASCQDGRGEYPTGGTMGKAFCLFDKLGLFADDNKMKINWDAVNGAFGSFANFAAECKDSDYDVDGGFWDDIGDWWGGEDFDYSSVDKALGNFYSCIAAKLVQEADDQFRNKFFAACPAY